MKAVVFDRIGSPLEVLTVRDVTPRALGPEDVRVEIHAASINPGDLWFIQGIYPPPKTPKFPAQIAGTGTSVGVVVEVGASVTRIAKGARVAFSYFDGWAEEAVIPAAWAIPIPEDYPRATAAMLGNVITAFDMLAQARVKEGDVLVLTAGNSAVATMVLQLARRQGVRVVPIVRREIPGFDLRTVGAEDVVSLARVGEGRAVIEAILAITGGRPPNAVIDAVGGPPVGDLVRALAIGGRAIVYGALKDGTFALSNADLLMRAASIESYAYRYFFAPPPPEDAAFLAHVTAATGGSDFVVRIAGEHPLEDFATAIRESVENPGAGKRLLVPARR